MATVAPRPPHVNRARCSARTKSGAACSNLAGLCGLCPSHARVDALRRDVEEDRAARTAVPGAVPSMTLAEREEIAAAVWPQPGTIYTTLARCAAVEEVACGRATPQLTPLERHRVELALRERDRGEAGP